MELPDKRLEPKQLPGFERQIAALEKNALSHVENVKSGSNTISLPLPDGYTADDIEWLRVKSKGATRLIPFLRQE